jgi:hypothetical protein
MDENNTESLPPSLIVIQANELISVRYNLPLSEQRLILTMINKIQSDDKDFKLYRISIAELASLSGVAKGSAYQAYKNIATSLLTRILEIYALGSRLQTNWVSSAEYIDGSGIVSLSFDPLLKPYLLQLKDSFVAARLKMLLSFKSQYTLRVYSLLKQYEQAKKPKIEVGALRDLLGLIKGQHTDYSSFKFNVLLPAQKELAEKADLTFEFDEIKHGRRVGAIYLYIAVNKRERKPAAEDLLPANGEGVPFPFEQLLSLVPAQHQGKKTVHFALGDFERVHGFDYVRRNILYSNAKADKSYVVFLNNALKNNWGHGWVSDQQEMPKKTNKQLTNLSPIK